MNAKNSLRRDIFHENSCFCKNYKLDLAENFSYYFSAAQPQHMAYPLRARRTYRLKRYASKRNYTQKPLRTYSRSSYYKRKPVRRVYRRTAYRRTAYKTRGPMPVRTNQSVSALRTMIKNNEDFMVMYTDGGQFATQVENNCAVSDFQCAHGNDLVSLYNALPTPASNNNAGKNNYNLVLKAASMTVTYTNQGLTPIDVFIWTVSAKRDSPTLNGDNQAYRPAASWQNGVEGTLYGNVPGGGTRGGFLHPHSQPSDSAIFQQFWHVCKRVKFQLLPGASRDVGLKIRNLPYKTAAAVDANTGVGGVQGITMALLMQMRGCVVQDPNSGNPYYARVFATAVENKRYHFTYASDNSKNIAYTVQTTTGGVAINQPTYINPLNGLPGGAPVPTRITNTAGQPVPVIGTGSTSKANAVGVQTATT